MPIDFNSIIQNRLPGLVSRGFADSQASFTQSDKFAQILKTLQPQQPETLTPSSQAARAQTSALDSAKPEEESGFNIFNALFGLLDIVGRPVRGAVGAATAFAHGDTKEAKSRLMDAALSPLDAMTLNIFDLAKEKDNTTGSEILDDLGWKAGTTTEDERRIRIAMAAGLSRRDAKRKFGIQGDKALSGEDAQSFETLLQEAKKRNPDLDLNPTMGDMKRAIDVQDFGGFAVEVLSDPLTYVSSGATATGKAAKTLGILAEQAPKLVEGVRAAGKLDDALRVIKGSAEIGAKQKKRLSKQVSLAWKNTKEGETPSLYLADNWAKQVREGQRAAVVGIGGKPLIKGGPVAEVLSHIGQTKTAEQILGKSTVSGVAGQILEMPGINKVVGGVKGIVRFTRDKLDVNTGVGKLDSLLTATDAESRRHVTEVGRVLNAFDLEIREAASGGLKGPAKDETIVKDVFHGTNRDFVKLDVNADRVAIKDKPGRGRARGVFFSPERKVASGYVANTLKETTENLGKGSWLNHENLIESLDNFQKAGRGLDEWARAITKHVEKLGKSGRAQGWVKGTVESWVGKTKRVNLLTYNARDGWYIFETSTKELPDIIKKIASQKQGIKRSKLAIVPYTEGIKPRVVSKSLKGKMVDLTDARKWPEKLVKQLKEGKGLDDARVYKEYQKALANEGQFHAINTIERSETLNKWLADNAVDIVKKPENDKLTGPFSYWVLNQKAIVDTADAVPTELPTNAAKALERTLRRQVSEAVELSKRTGGDFMEAAEAARVSLGLSNELTGHTETVAKIAAGIARINESVLQRASQVPTRIRELNDDTIQYMHRMLSDDAKGFFRSQKKAKKFADATGLEFNARSRTFNMRSDASRGKTLDEVNALFKEKHGIDLFNPDPIASTRESVRLTQRAIANARFGARFVEEYGTGTDEAVDALIGSIEELPERLLNMRKGAEIDAATSQAAARVARKEGREHIGEVAENLRKTRASKFVDPETVPEGMDVMGVANHFKKVLKEQDLAEEGTVSAFDIYNRLGLKLPDTPEELAKLVSVRVPDEAAAFVTRALKLQKDPTPFIKQYDRITQWLKASVTVPFPMFHGRNMLENMFKNVVEGNVNPRNYKNAAKFLSQASDLAAGSPDWVGKAANKLKAAFKKMGEPDKQAMKDLADAGLGKNYSEIVDWMVAHGILDNRITSEFGDVLQDGAAGVNKVARQVRGLGGMVAKEIGTQGGVIRGGFALSAGTENLHRVSLFMHKIDKGYSAIEAASEVKRVFFDYRAMTNFETTYAKRLGFFYSFYRNNLRYIMQSFFTKPALTKQILRLFQNDPDNPKQRWLSDKASFTAGAKEVSLGFIPQQQFNMFGFDGEDVWDKVTNKAADVAGLANPMLSTPLEVAFNKDLFTGGPLLSETTSVDWSFAPESVQKAIGYRQTPDGRHKIGRIWNLVFGAVPVLGRFSSTAIQLTSKERTYWEKLTRVVSGVNVQDRDLEKDDLALIDRNLMRAQTSLPLVSKDGRGNYRVNTTTANGRVASALIFPSKGKMRDLGLAPEVLFQLKPYMTFDNEGEVRVTGILRLKMHELAVQMYPKEQAFFDGMEARAAVVKSVQGRNQDVLGEQAAEQFNAFLQGTR